LSYHGLVFFDEPTLANISVVSRRWRRSGSAELHHPTIRLRHLHLWFTHGSVRVRHMVVGL